jgi:hypothetical protein
MKYSTQNMILHHDHDDVMIKFFPVAMRVVLVFNRRW